ncbi:lipid-binding SYLF domain-containing protein [Zavarzinia sp. CC-PAN008]|uniref:lipid-binding SYLF domain-containing protein n=1 Tax=Zavarzinia sp. CC-PAN008 TaxID=3243332 RepID=UPI003F745944
MTLQLTRRGALGALGMLGAAGLVKVASNPAFAASSTQILVDKARTTVQTLAADPNLQAMRRQLRTATGVLIIPQLLKGAFIIGGSGGEGVLLGRNGNGWSSPAFYTMAAASIGFQIGAQSQEIIFIITNENGLRAVMRNEMKLGVDASIAIGPIGAGIEGSTTTNLDADIIAYSKAEGLFGGGALNGAGILSSDSMNQEYYGRPVGPADIVVRRSVTNPGAAGLQQALSSAVTA